MDKRETRYSVAALARLAGISVRALHHYDSIGLLEPESRTPSGYRSYGPAELKKLQQILFFRELGFPLEEIRRITGKGDFDSVHALKEHRRLLLEKVERLERLVATIDKTIADAAKGGDMLSDKDLYEGFSTEKIELMKTRAREKYGKAYEESDRKVRGMTKEQFKEIGMRGAGLENEFAALKKAGTSPASAAAQGLAGRWRAHIENFWTPTAESFAGLGSMYAEDPDFRYRYESMEAGLADFMRDAIHAYARAGMKG